MIDFIFSEIFDLLLCGMIDSKSKPCLQIVILADDPRKLTGALRFQVENVGEKSTVLCSVIDAVFVTAEGERKGMVFDVAEQDLILPSFTPRVFHATARKLQAERAIGKDKRYCFEYGDGGVKTIEFSG